MMIKQMKKQLKLGLQIDNLMYVLPLASQYQLSLLSFAVSSMGQNFKQNECNQLHKPGILYLYTVLCCITFIP